MSPSGLSISSVIQGAGGTVAAPPGFRKLDMEGCSDHIPAPFREAHPAADVGL